MHMMFYLVVLKVRVNHIMAVSSGAATTLGSNLARSIALTLHGWSGTDYATSVCIFTLAICIAYKYAGYNQMLHL